MNGPIIEAGHLGGYREGGDVATYFPHLWRWLVDVLGVRSVLDVGSGGGVALDYFNGGIAIARHGHVLRVEDVLGIEGVPQDHPSIVQHDYTEGAYEPPMASSDDGLWDLAWCCEFVEHVEERYIPNFLHTFRSARLVLMTHAEPGQQGYHHVALKPREFWVRQLASAGFVLDAGLTETTRALAALNLSPWNHFVRSGLAFRRVS